MESTKTVVVVRRTVSFMAYRSVKRHANPLCFRNSLKTFFRHFFFRRIQHPTGQGLPHVFLGLRCELWDSNP